MKTPQEEQYRREYEIIKQNLENKTFLSVPKNNEYLLGFLESKRNGSFGRIAYSQGIGYKTVIKLARSITKVEHYFNKPIDEITEQEIITFRDKLNNDEIYKDKTLIKWEEKKVYGKKKKISKYKIIPTNIPVSYRTKRAYKNSFCELFNFVIEYNKEKYNKEIKDITKFFKIIKPSDFQEISVKFITDGEIITLLNNIRNRDFKALVQLSLMSGARPCEIVNVKYGKGNNLYKNKEGKWIIHLPKLKRISYTKYPFIVDMYEDELYPYFENLNKKEGELVFKITLKTFRKLMNHYTTKYLGKPYSPKILRKTARMLRTNAGYTEMWINKLMGHAPGSTVQGHYTCYEGIKNESEANEKLKDMQYPSIKKDYDKIKLELLAEKQNRIEMQQQFDDLKVHIDKILEAKQLYQELKEKSKK